VNSVPEPVPGENKILNKPPDTENVHLCRNFLLGQVVKNN
jgi:hypothetical protein